MTDSSGSSLQHDHNAQETTMKPGELLRSQFPQRDRAFYCNWSRTWKQGWSWARDSFFRPSDRTVARALFPVRAKIVAKLDQPRRKA